MKNEYKLYDESYWIVVFALFYITYDVVTADRELQSRVLSALSVTFWWVLILFKVHAIECHDEGTLIFKGILRKTTVHAKDIIAFQDALRGLRLVLKNKSIVLWPFVERQGEFKILLKSLNPDIEFIDVSNEATKSTARLGLLFWGMIVLFILSTVGLFYQLVFRN